MRARRQPRTLVVPVLGGGITDAVLDRAADEARGRGARLVIHGRARVVADAAPLFSLAPIVPSHTYREPSPC